MLLPCMQGMTPGSRFCARPCRVLLHRATLLGCLCEACPVLAGLECSMWLPGEGPKHFIALQCMTLQVACACAELRSAAMLVTRCCVGSAARAATLHAVARSSFDGGVCTPLTVAEVAVSFACLAAWLLPNRRLIAACLPVPSYPRVLLLHASETFTSCCAD
ncbi:hypothetical protein COO60DRAFT_1597867 [Scenedesmus sp. NREL 46B-D3]|nr:hypothetical protein COO60DRAFT_1597867 [Scenedesmus sp. NREL 46B-D3]